MYEPKFLQLPTISGILLLQASLGLPEYLILVDCNPETVKELLISNKFWPKSPLTFLTEIRKHSGFGKTNPTTQIEA